MIDKIKSVIEEMRGIADWKIVEQKVAAKELFFIKKNIDMPRDKKVSHYKVTLYKEFSEEGIKYRGASSCSIHPTMNEIEIRGALADSLFAAGFVKNKYYPLVDPDNEVQPELNSKFAERSLSEWMPGLTEAVSKADDFVKGRVNSAELFLNKYKIRIVNSKGVDVAFAGYKGELEFIVNWQEEGEEIELYKHLKFADYNPEMLSAEVKKMLILAREKALAGPTPSLKDYPVLLTGEPVKEFFKYYYLQSAAKSVYEKISTAKLGENIQGKDIKGDLINIKSDPFMENSTESAPYDYDGFPLKKLTIYKDGILTKYWGNKRYSHYLDKDTTGNLKNIIVEGGKRTVADLKAEPHLELLAFSDFQMDPITGDFAGEIRLGRFYDGDKTVPVTGGSISGNVKEVQQEMYLSKEVQKINDFSGPLSISLKGVSISGS